LETAICSGRISGHRSKIQVVKKGTGRSVDGMAPLFINQIGPFEWILILAVILILFGGRKIPQLAKDLGSGIREFRKSVTGAAPELEEPKNESPNTEKTKRKTKSKSKS
jgi:sec-independent protein translocase protein TatA